MKYHSILLILLLFFCSHAMEQRQNKKEPRRHTSLVDIECNQINYKKLLKKELESVLAPVKKAVDLKRSNSLTMISQILENYNPQQENQD